MRINNSELASHVVKCCTVNIGQLYFFNHIVVSEFNEGAHVSYKNVQELIKVIKDHFGSKKPFGFISNMVHSYSMNPINSSKFKKELNNLTTYGVVSYTTEGRMSAEIENNFCENKNICFNDLYDATDTVRKKVTQYKSPLI